MDVGVRELKQNLSKYLEMATRGEVIRVTDRGRPKAILAPLPDQVRLEQGIDEGWISPATVNPPRAVRRAKSDRRIADVLAEDREG